jgi:hypothetical protein
MLAIHVIYAIVYNSFISTIINYKGYVMRKQVYIYSIFFLILPPLMLEGAAGAFRNKFPEMSKGFKKSMFDHETRKKCEEKVKEPLHFKRVEKDGYYLGQACGMVLDAIVAWGTSKAIAKVIEKPTHPIQEYKEQGGIPGVIASATEEALTVGVPLALGAASLKAAEAGVGLGTYMSGGGLATTAAETMPWATTVAAQSNFCPAPIPAPVSLLTSQSAPLITKSQLEMTAAATPLMVKHSMAYYPPAQQQTIMQNMKQTAVSVANAPGITASEAAGAAIGIATADKVGAFNLFSTIRAGFVRWGESIRWLP